VGIAAGDCRLLEPLLWSPERLIDAVVDGRLHASCARELVGWEASDQEAYLVALTDLSPSRQTQRELAEWLEELGCAEGVSIEALIEEIVLPIASDARLNPPQRIARIHQEVYTRRFPRFTAARRRWESAARRLTAGSKAIRIIPASFFEKDHLELHLRIGSADEAQGLFRELAAMPRQLWDTLIHPRASGGGRG
jgi:ParB family chromosome partitioning protein